MKDYFTIMLSCLIWGLTSCSDSDKSLSMLPSTVSTQVQDAFLKRYPNATNISWQSKGQYAIAHFSLPLTRSTNTSKNSAWLDQHAEWHMTETDMPFSALPQLIQSAFASGEYSSWRVDEVERIERQGMEVVYVIEVNGSIQSKQTKIDLYYTADGILIKEVIAPAMDNDYEDFIPSTPTVSINEYLKKNYPNARILEIDSENGFTEVELLDTHTKRKLFFDRTSTWRYTKTEVRLNDVPNKVIEALKSSKYSSYRIDDIDHYQLPESSYYHFDLESSKGDVKINITIEGELSIAKPSVDNNDTDSASMLPEIIKNFIGNKYPESRLLEYENKNGLLEVEILHASCQKDIYFNGSNSWVMSKWDVKQPELPTTVLAAIKSSEYASYEIDDIEYVQEPSLEYYGIELEYDDRGVYLRIDRQGKILK